MSEASTNQWGWARNTGPANKARRGVRVNDPGPEWEAIRKRLLKVAARQEPGVSTVAALAEHLGRSSKTTWRWASGQFWPPASVAKKIKRWVVKMGG